MVIWLGTIHRLETAAWTRVATAEKVILRTVYTGLGARKRAQGMHGGGEERYPAYTRIQEAINVNQ